MTLIDVKWNTYIDSDKKNNNNIQKYFCKRLHSKLVWRVTSDLKSEEFVGKFHEEELQEEKRKKKKKSLGKKKINYMSNGKMI